MLPSGTKRARRKAADGGPAMTRPGSSLAPPARSYAEPDTGLPGGLNISPGVEAPAGEVPERMRVPGPSVPPRALIPHRQAVLPPADHHSGPHPAVRRLLGIRSLTTGWWPRLRYTRHLRGELAGDRHRDDGLLVVVEPRDFGGNIVNAPGDISVALLDPALTGEQARLRRWDFAAAETRGDDPHGPAARDSPAIALEFRAGPRSAEGFCPLHDPRRPETPGRTADFGRPRWSAGPA